MFQLSIKDCLHYITSGHCLIEYFVLGFFEIFYKSGCIAFKRSQRFSRVGLSHSHSFKRRVRLKGV